MTITPLTVYLIMQADQLNFTLCVISAISGVALLITTIALAIDRAEDGEVYKRFRMAPFYCVWVALLSAAICAPTTKTLCAAIVVPAIANSQAIQKDFPELYNLAVEKLKEQLAPAK